MGHLTGSLLATVLASAGVVLGHGHVSNIVANGVYYQGYLPDVYPYMTNPPTVIGWTATNTDNGFVAPDAFGGSDIICHRGGANAGGHATVAAGSYISLQWSTWPDSHHGPVIDYLANCNGNCETVDKTTLQFFKIDGPGWVSGANPGLWASDTLIANNFTWLVQIPSTIAPGNYVLRHEIIALHGAGSVNGAQAYPQCFNLAITGTGTLKPSGTYGTALYKSTDPGILFNLYTSPIAYTVPGPTLISGVSSSVPQSSVSATATSSPTIPGSSAATTTTSVATSTSSSSVRSTTSTTAATTTTISTSTITSTTSAGTGSAQTHYGQCGGSGWTGPTSCSSPYTCSTLNAYYYQCV